MHDIAIILEINTIDFFVSKIRRQIESRNDCEDNFKS